MSTPPCSWPVDTTCLPDVTGEEQPRLIEAIDAATLILWALTGRRYGACPTIARPCPPRTTGDATGGPWMTPILDHGQWTNTPCGRAGCRPGGGVAIPLPGPVQEVTEVTIDGDPLDPDSYRLEGNWLYRTNGDPWPPQDMTMPAGHPGTWTVTYLRGIEPPAGAATMVGRLAAELYRSCADPNRCRLPRRATQVQRQGVTVQMTDPSLIIRDGMTGLTDVDLWVAALNPHRLSEAPTVWTPETQEL